MANLNGFNWEKKYTIHIYATWHFGSIDNLMQSIDDRRRRRHICRSSWVLRRCHYHYLPFRMREIRFMLVPLSSPWPYVCVCADGRALVDDGEMGVGDLTFSRRLQWRRYEYLLSTIRTIAHSSSMDQIDEGEWENKQINLFFATKSRRLRLARALIEKMNFEMIHARCDTDLRLSAFQLLSSKNRCKLHGRPDVEQRLSSLQRRTVKRIKNTQRTKWSEDDGENIEGAWLAAYADSWGISNGSACIMGSYITLSRFRAATEHDQHFYDAKTNFNSIAPFCNARRDHGRHWRWWIPHKTRSWQANRFSIECCQCILRSDALVFLLIKQHVACHGQNEYQFVWHLSREDSKSIRWSHAGTHYTARDGLHRIRTQAQTRANKLFQIIHIFRFNRNLGSLFRP